MFGATYFGEAYFDCPIYINVRDRVEDLRRLVAWLERAGHERITLVDNASTYEPLLDYLRATPHDVVCLGRNVGSRSLWHADLAPRGWFVWTDPDVVPVADCPLDAVGRLRESLDRYPLWPKAGLGLRLDDVPADLKCLPWECSLVDAPRELEPGVYGSLVDTTFALYRPGGTHSYHALRTGWPYVMRHSPWYEAATEAERVERDYYLAHARGGCEGSSWKDGLQT